MLYSLMMIIFLSLILAGIAKKLHLPNIISFLLTGMILGPYLLDWIDDSILAISIELRQIALVLILFRAGLALQLDSLKKVGKTAILLSFIPATIELLAISFLAPLIFGISYIEALLLGSVLAAVSPAVVIPRMIRLQKEKRGTANHIPELIMAGSSIDDIYVIVLFFAFLPLQTSNTLSFLTLLNIPLSIILGVGVGVLVGLILIWLFRKIHIRDTIKTIMIFGVAFLLLVIEEQIKTTIPFSGLIGVMVMGMILLRFYPLLANRLTPKMEKLWVGAEMMLFVLVGSSVSLFALKSNVLLALLLITIALLFRMLAVSGCLIKSKTTSKERLYIAFSYIPKATVQAAIGSIPYTMGLPSGEIILVCSVVAILFSAPIGAFLLDFSASSLLDNE